MKKILIFLLLLFILSGCGSGKRAFEDDYQMFKGTRHVFVKEDYKTIYNVLTKKKGTSVIVFAFDPDLYECPFCMAALPILNEAALDLGVDKIMYLDIRTMRVERNQAYLDLLTVIGDQVDDLIIRDGKEEIVVPDVYVIQDGKILAHHIATIKDEMGAFIYNLNDEQKEELKNIYKDLLKNIQS